MFVNIDALKDDMDIIIMSAAIADFTPKSKADNKIKKDGNGLTLELQPTVDILKHLGAHKKDGQILIGYAMETIDLINNAKAKLVKKNCDYIIANTISSNNQGFRSDENIVTIISKDQVVELDKLTKSEIAKRIIELCI